MSNFRRSVTTWMDLTVLLAGLTAPHCANASTLSLAFVTGPPAIGYVNYAFTIQVGIVDQNGVVDQSEQDNITLSLIAGPPGATFAFVTESTVFGIATFSGLEFSEASNGIPYQFEATEDLLGLASIDSDPFTISSGTPPTPIPAAWSLFVAGVGVLGLLGWRRRKTVAAIAA